MRIRREAQSTLQVVDWRCGAPEDHSKDCNSEDNSEGIEEEGEKGEEGQPGKVVA